MIFIGGRKFMFGERLKDLRTTKGISRSELANILGTTKQIVANWENNRSQPTITILVKLAKYFNVRVNYLLGLD